ncbi:MAG: hypothetical protein HXX10_07555 [Rhodoplanes sp.]|uniref:hypothetical protein n=1 Tax=Rhodoplanes sp. TaxID=1968906 RepID=UPI0017E61BFF|nr:hypothetical protein [Rhodoplanes sp.]NVO13876.1 hypothetical protein [Rhodoplanes sp.]
MPTCYEWDIEAVDAHGDIQDHDHSNQLDYDSAYLRKALARDGYHLVLVRDVCDAGGSVEDRSWAYVDDNRLPELFDDLQGTGKKVPKRFHVELAAAIANLPKEP